MGQIIDLSALLGRVRKLVVPTYGDATDNPPAINDRGELLVSKVLPDRAEITRLGRTFTRAIPTGSAFTHVAAWPTTRAELVIQNGEAAGGKSYVFDSVWAANAATSIAAASAYTLLGQIVNANPAPAAVTDNTAVLTWNRSGNGTFTSLSKAAVANTSYGVASKWEVLPAPSQAGAAASIGLAAYADLWGSWILPPGGIMLFNLVAGTATGTAILGATWHEVQLPIL
jgi:hypothetical protein